jgi:tRNA(Ile)-lysidine synthase
MMPLGMKKFKKISDLLTDLKLPLSAKKRVQVLCDAEKIIWLVGFRIDERVKRNGRETRAGRVFLSVVQPD